MLEFALKYDSELLASGVLELQWSWKAYGAAVLSIALLAALGSGYHRPNPTLRGVDRLGLWALRTALLSVLLFLLLDPRLRVEMDEPIRGHVIVLLDDSLSMRIADNDGPTRAELVDRFFTPGEGSIATLLEKRVDVRYQRFSNTLVSMTAGERLTYSGTRSKLADALANLARGAEAQSRAGVILVTDGIGDDPGALHKTGRALRAAGIPVHVIGVGAEKFEREVELKNVQLPRRVLRGDAVEASVVVSHRGFSGQPVTLKVIEESIVVAERRLALTDERFATMQIPLEFTKPGPRRLSFRVAAQPGDTLMENNETHRVVDVRGTPLRILHIEGEPRFEVKFLRRAVSEDNEIRLTSLIRTAENKYYRLGVEDANELAGGLPESEEAWFRYHAVVLGSIDDDVLDEAQQKRLRDFVSRRGGGLVLLGGNRAFSQGGYARSTLASLAPVVLNGTESVVPIRVPVRPTEEGRLDLLLRFDRSGVDRDVWDRLPPLTVVNPIRFAKPGASTILEGVDGTGQRLVVLAWQRYGRGTVAAFPVRDSWRWQMHADVPVDDETHEWFWRNLLRHVARPAGERIRLYVEPHEAAVGDTVSVQAEILDDAYHPDPNADLSLSVTAPSGEFRRIPFDRSLSSQSPYYVSFVVREVGRHYLRIRLRKPSGEYIDTDTALEVDGLGSEYHDAELDVARLTQLAASTGGRFFRIEDARDVVDFVDDTTDTRRVERRLPLRDAPLLLAILILLAGVEWLWRRRRRMP